MSTQKQRELVLIERNCYSGEERELAVGFSAEEIAAQLDRLEVQD